MNTIESRRANPLMRTSLGLLLVLCLLLGPVRIPAEGLQAAASEDVWTTYTNGNYVTDLAIEGDFLWAATAGGVVCWDIRDGTYVKYTASDGLADNSVSAVAIDIDGSKWFGTSRGASHFDGTTWTTYDTSNSGLTSHFFKAITIDRNGGKWFGAFHGGATYFDGTTWTPYTPYNSGLPDDDIYAIAIDLDGSVWFGTYDRGVSHFDGTTWTTYDTSNSGLAENKVFAIAIDVDGSKWFGTWCGGVSHFDGTTWTTYTWDNSSLPSKCVGTITIDNDGNKWFGTAYGLTHFDGTTWTTYDASNSGITAGSVSAIAIGDDGTKWLGFSDQGVNAFDGTTWTAYTTPDRLVNNGVQSMAVDRSGGRWFGTARGTSWMLGSVWNNYTRANSKLKSDDIEAVAIAGDDTVWFGTYDGVTHFDGSTWATYDTYNSGLVDNDVRTIAVGLDDSVWFGTYENGVSHLKDNTWTTHDTTNSGLASNYIEAIAVDNDGGAWFGFGWRGGGISHFDGATWTTYDTSNSGLLNDEVDAIATENNGAKWFGHHWHGVSRFDGTTWTTYTTSNSGLVSGSILTIFIDDDGHKWFGTSDGVSHFDGINWITYTPSNSGLTDLPVTSITIDDNGTKWFGTDGGVSRLGLSPEYETCIRVIDHNGNPLPGTRVYRNGTLIADSENVPYTTNAIGILIAYGLGPADRLVALAPQHVQPTVRAAHGPLGQDWAYTINTTNAHLDAHGQITTTQAYNPATGEHLLTTSNDNVLVTFRLVVSVEWDATDEYLAEIERAVHRASDYLYDLTDGQMAFGRVTLYDNGAHWADADIQISAKNTVRPHAYIGGITADDPSHVIRIGRGWDGGSGNQGPWDQPDGYRTLAHEFGHYALHLYDEYFGYDFDQNDNLVGEWPAYCTGPENRDPATDAVNASAMDYQYTTSELSARGVPGMWSDLCEQTAQWQLTERQLGQGESAWETVVRLYADTESTPRWQLTTPPQRGSVLAGPAGVPTDVLALPTVVISNTGASVPPIQLTVYDDQGKPCWGANVALYKLGGRVLGQGFADPDGGLDVYGAEEGDILRAMTMDGGLAGSATVGAGTEVALYLSPVSVLASLATANIPHMRPHMRVIAEPGPSPDTVDLLVYLEGFGPGADPSVIVTEPGSEVGHAPTLSYSAQTGAYEGRIGFSATERGTGRIRAMGAVGNSLVRLQSTYRLHKVLNDASQDVYSDDGNLSLHLEPGSLPGNEAYVVVMPPGAIPGSLPEGLALASDVYDVTASGALATLVKPALLSIRSTGLQSTRTTTPRSGVYRWHPHTQVWQQIAQQETAVPILALGAYALLAPPGPTGVVVFMPIVLKEVP